jgi:hypothetical protein
MEVPRRVGAAASLSIVIFVLAACDEPGAPPGCGYGDGGRPVAGSFLSWNVYLGASVRPLILADSTEWPAIVEAGFEQVLQTNFAERATAIAGRIDAVDPDLIGLQEVAHWLVQSPGDEATTNPTPATETVADFLAILLSALEARGLAYDAVVVTTNVDIELPSASGDDVRFKDRDVILARTGVATLNPQSGDFRARFSFAGITVVRGWASIDAVIDGDTVRFTTTHLETEELERLLGLQRDQVNELLATWCDANLPLVVTGDFNSDPRDTTTAAYGALTGAGFVDAWSAAGTGTPGFTCCQSADLSNATSALSQRVDQVFFRGAARVIDAALLGADPGERTPSGLWPSDHAGVFATLRPLPPGRRAR